MAHRLALLAALALGAVAAPAPAQQPVAGPPPAPCAGLAFADVRGDNVSDPAGLGGPAGGAGQPNTDIVGGFFTTRGGVVTANLQLAVLDRQVSTEAVGGQWYYVFFRTDDGPEHFVRAAIRPDGVSFRYGTFDAATGMYTTRAPIEGRLFEGDGGIIRMAIPREVAPAGRVLHGPRAAVNYVTGWDDVYGINVHQDVAPDSGGGEPYTVAECPRTGGVSGQIGPIVSPGIVPGRTRGQAAQSEALPIAVPTTLARARKARSGVKVPLEVKAKRPIARLSVAILARSGKGNALATGKLGWVSGRGTVPLKVRKKLKPGGYVLKATGTVEGRFLQFVKQVQVKK